MRLIVIGATGTIGQAVVAALGKRHEVVPVTRRTEPFRVDISSAASVRALFEHIGPIDGVICAAGAARFKPLADLSDDDFAFCLQNKLMGQVHIVREAVKCVRDRGVIVVTSGILSRAPTPGSSAISLVNAGLEAFARAAALEAPRGIRINVVSPPWVSETLTKLRMDPNLGLTASTVAEAYVDVVQGSMTGQVIELIA
ncbi:MAG TPA: short chain dehydrogenase [Burkholderiaceae bacterium]|nr:short chain dehydrogenase [Burkholderiaceae bacterium]